MDESELENLEYKIKMQKSLKQKWYIGYCDSGKKCWCRTIITKPFDKKQLEDDYEYNDLFYICNSGKLDKNVVKHLVKIHNEYIENDSLKI